MHASPVMSGALVDQAQDLQPALSRTQEREKSVRAEGRDSMQFKNKFGLKKHKLELKYEVRGGKRTVEHEAAFGKWYKVKSSMDSVSVRIPLGRSALCASQQRRGI